MAVVLWPHLEYCIVCVVNIFSDSEKEGFVYSTPSVCIVFVFFPHGILYLNSKVSM